MRLVLGIIQPRSSLAIATYPGWCYAFIMNAEIVTPTEYQQMRSEWTQTTGGFIPGAEQVVLNSSANRDKIAARARAWAEGFMSEHGLEEWDLDEEVNIDESFEGISIVSVVTMRDPQERPIGKTLSGPDRSVSGIRRISALSPVRDDHDRSAQMRDGMVARVGGSSPEEGVLKLYKSWNLEDLDEMGVELPWSPPEDADRQPVEE